MNGLLLIWGIILIYFFTYLFLCLIHRLYICIKIYTNKETFGNIVIYSSGEWVEYSVFNKCGDMVQVYTPGIFPGRLHWKNLNEVKYKEIYKC